MDDAVECVRCDAELDAFLSRTEALSSAEAPGTAEAAGTPGAGRVYRAALIRPGDWLGKNMRCPPAVLQVAASKFGGLASFLNPPAATPGQHGHPMLERLLGVTENAHWDDALQAVVADYRLADTDAAREFRRLVDGWLAARAAGQPVPAIGLSAVPWVRLGPPDADGVREVREIVRVDQVDAVYRPAAGGEFLQVLNSADHVAFCAANDEAKPHHLQHKMRRYQITGGASMNQDVLPETTADQGIDQAEFSHLNTVEGLLAAARQSTLDARLAASGLPERWRTVVRASLAADWALDQLDAAITRVRTAWAEDEAARTVQGIRPLGGNDQRVGRAVLGGMQGQAQLSSGLDQITEAFAALAEGRTPRDGIARLAGLRDFYTLTTGDYEMTGQFRGERVYLANANSTTMANIVANVLNKLVVAEFQQYPRWWEPIVRRESFASLQTVKWTTLGGVGELPSVNEGAAYTELEWTDASESATWQKRGGYLGLTLEAMDKDDTGHIRRIAPALAQSAWLTLGRAVSALFTSNSGVGPDLSDNTPLFDGSRSNLGSAALSATSWAAAKLAMRKQVELGSGERLGALTAPRSLLVPPDLEGVALALFASEGVLGSGNNDVNPHATGGNTFDARLAAARQHIVVVDLWDDTNNWAAVADPRLYPTIGMGFRYGETPELFSVASPTSGLMFTNDVLPVKVRWFFAVGPQDYRGLYKANVA